MIKRILQLLIFSTVAAAAWNLTVSSPARAAYDGNNLIDNQIFLDYNVMNESQIQAFLSSKGGALANYTDPSSQPANQTAAHIIWDAAQSYGVSPRVIMATLQKEQSLITDPNPDPSQYSFAMGYGCPDGGGCSTAGLWNQVGWGTFQLRANFERSVGNTWPSGSTKGYACPSGPNTWYSTGLIPGRTVDFYGYNSSTTFNSSTYAGVMATVTIANQATAALYCYTPHPYHPTSPYYSGSYNFVTSFESWWGSTHIPSYSWNWTSQTPLNSSLTAVTPGQKISLTISAQNTGTATWYQGGTNPTRLGTAHANDRQSVFYDSSWIGATRPAGLNQASVAPGASGTFTFTVQAPNTPGTYMEYFNIVTDGITWLNDPNVYYQFTVVSPSLASTAISNTAPASMNRGTITSVTATVRNDGNVTWYKSGKYPVRLGTSSPFDRTSQLYDSSWLSQNRVVSLNETSVAPGANGTFTFTIKAPQTATPISEKFSVVIDGMGWTSSVTVLSIDIIGSYTATSTDQTVNVIAGQTANITFAFTNTGSATWSNSGTNPVRLGTINPMDRSSAFCINSWVSCNRPTTLTQAGVSPNSIGNFTFTIKTQPNQSGTYKESFMPVADGLRWFDSAPVTLTINISSATWSYSSPTIAYYSDSSKSTIINPAQLSPGQTAWAVVTATNAGTSTWGNSGPNPVRLGTASPLDRMSRFYDSSWLSQDRPANLAQSSVAPGATGTFEFGLRVPAGGGTFNEHFNIVVDGIAWMADQNINLPLTVLTNYSWSFVTEGAYTDSSKTTAVDLSSLTPGQVFYFSITVKNTGTATWYKSGSYPIRLGTSRPLDYLNNRFYHSFWLSHNRATGLAELNVAPGSNGTFEGYFKAPSTPGTYQNSDYFQAVVDGITWLNDIGIFIPATVQ